MKNAKNSFCIMLIAALLCNLCACGAASEAAIGADKAYTQPAQSEAPLVIAPPKPSDKTVPGYISTELENPEWVESWDGCEALGDTLYIAAYTAQGGIAAAGFDTLTGQWLRYDLETGNALYPIISGFSAAADSLWMLLRDGYSEAEKENRNYSRKLDYYLVHLNLTTGNQTCSHLDFWKEGNAYLCSFIALDAGRALVGDGEKVYLLGNEGDILDMSDIQVLGTGLHVRSGNALYIETDSGLSLLDTQTLQYVESVSRIGYPVYSSSLDHLLFTQNETLYRVDPFSGEKTELLSWLDTALSYSNMYGWKGFENSKGDIYHLTNVLTRVSKGEVPVKKVLTLACMGDASDDLYQYSSKEYTCPDSLMDAVIRFNSSDPEFKIEIKPLVYHDEAERTRILIELAAESDIDILDTSLLPEGAVDSQLLVDLLPYIDADEGISRDDFIPSLLSAMIRNGSLYEYTDRYTMLTVLARKDMAKDSVGWTAEDFKNSVKTASQGDMYSLSPSDMDGLITLFSWAATAEFMDWSNMTCSFDTPAFAHWLSILQSLSNGSGASHVDAAITYDLAATIGLRARMALKGDYIPIGFPESVGNGSYFIKLGASEPSGGSGRITPEIWTGGCNTSLGIMASSTNRDGAWRFMRTFMMGETEPSLFKGLPVRRDCFERAVEAELKKEQPDYYGEFELFNNADADYLRELVYNTDRIVCCDESVITAIRTEVNAFLGGKYSAEEAARQLQSRLSIYMAEQA